MFVFIYCFVLFTFDDSESSISIIKTMSGQEIFAFDKLTSDEDALHESDKINSYIQPKPNGDFVKEKAQKFLDAAYFQLTSPDTSPLSKCMILHVISS